MVAAVENSPLKRAWLRESCMPHWGGPGRGPAVTLRSDTVPVLLFWP